MRVVIRTVDSEVCSKRISGGAASESLEPKVITVEDTPTDGAMWGRSLTMMVGTNSAGRPGSTTAILGSATEYHRLGSRE